MARKSHQDSAVRFVTAKRGPERATKTRQYELLRPRVGQKEPPRLDIPICYGEPRPASTIRYGQKWARKNHQDSAVRFVTTKRGPRVGQNDSAVRFVTAKSGPERRIKIRQYDLLRPRVGQKEPIRLDNTMCYSQECARKSRQDSAVRFVVAKSGPERAAKTRQAIYFVTAKSGPKRAAKIRQYDLLREKKSHQDSAIRFVTAKTRLERTTKTLKYD